jgi:hypothetical protein
MEDAAESAYFDAREGLEPGYWRCECDNVTTDDDMHQVSSNPFSSPVCGDCFEQFLKEHKDEE